jgi:hypothetical protein
LDGIRRLTMDSIPWLPTPSRNGLTKYLQDFVAMSNLPYLDGSHFIILGCIESLQHPVEDIPSIHYGFKQCERIIRLICALLNTITVPSHQIEFCRKIQYIRSKQEWTNLLTDLLLRVFEDLKSFQWIGSALLQSSIPIIDQLLREADLEDLLRPIWRSTKIINHCLKYLMLPLKLKETELWYMMRKSFENSDLSTAIQDFVGKLGPIIIRDSKDHPASHIVVAEFIQYLMEYSGNILFLSGL